MTYQLRNVVIAVVLGLLAAVLTTAYVTNYRKNVQHGQQDVGVLVAATNIPAATAGAQVDAVGNRKVDENGSNSRHYDRVVLRDLLVLRAPAAADIKQADLSSTQHYNVMLAVTDSQASKLMFVVKNADPNASPDGG